MALGDPYRIEPIWEGRTAVIIAGGPSLSPMQLHHIALARGDDRCRVIAVNDAVFVASYADWLHAGDLKWWRWHVQRVGRLGFAGIKTTCSDDVPAPWVHGYLEYCGDAGFDPRPTHLKSGRSSAYQAAAIAIHAGCKRILLVALDMKRGPNGELHWFGEHPEKNPTVNHGVQMAPMWDTLVPTLEERGIQVLNCSPDSALETFPKADLFSELHRSTR